MLTLQKREKWVKERRNVAIGDIVLIVEETSARCHWPLGRVIEVHEGRNKRVRSVTLKLKDKLLMRPISKLVMLLEASVET